MEVCHGQPSQVSLLRDGHEFGNHGLVDKSPLVAVFFSRDFHGEGVNCLSHTVDG